MSNKLTSLTGFGEGDPKPEKKGAKAKALSAKMGKKDDYAERRSVAKHELKSMVRNLPHDLKRKMSYRSHLRTHLLKENDPRKWEKYK